MTSISGVTFEEAWATRTAGLLDGLPVHFIGHEALLRKKTDSGRPKDLIDIEALRKPGPKGI